MVNTTTTKSQLWSPDTCSCVLEMSYETGPEISLKDAVMSLKKVHKKCEYHSTLSNDDEVWSAVTEENPRKNIAIAKLVENAPDDWVEVVNEKTGEKKLKDGIAVDYDFKFEKDKTKRTLELSVIGVESTSLENTKKTAIQSTLNTEFSNKTKHGDVVFKDAKKTRDDISVLDDSTIPIRKK